MSVILQTAPEWWAVFGVLAGLCVVSIIIGREPTPPTSTMSEEKDAARFMRFQARFLSVWILMIAGDWFQGPYVYALYQVCDFGIDKIGVLFILGFGASAVMGTFIGSIADKYGRKKIGIFYGVVYALSCLTKHSCDYGLLLLGRFFGGIATSLLFSIFESWMVDQHRKEGFPDALLGRTFSYMGFLNPFTAIISGTIANALAAKWTVVAPFDAAGILLTLGTILLIWLWDENYGDADISLGEQYSHTWRLLTQDKMIWRVGMVQSLFEGAMYIFVFMWTPLLQKSLDLDNARSKEVLGLVFASFMTAAMFGSSVYKALIKFGVANHHIAVVTIFLSTIGLFLPGISQEPYPAVIGCLIFEVCVGLYWPAVGVLRSEYVPEETRATMYNIFRIPLNIIVVGVLIDVQHLEFYHVFLMCGSFMALAFLFTISLVRNRAGYVAIDNQKIKNVED
eukprot:GFYU01010431.1.p1 GENE.GFYU01010431.1~~GFYU01010431.1.p1  ORF type:complete len:452 (-),score=126.51 GFYU01010431.1:397-1752(-)